MITQSVSNNTNPLQIQPTNLGTLEYEGKTWKVSVIYTDDDGNVVNAPAHLDASRIHALTKDLLRQMPQIENNSRIEISEKGVSAGDQSVPHDDIYQTQQCWNALYGALMGNDKPKQQATATQAHVILDSIQTPANSNDPVVEDNPVVTTNPNDSVVGSAPEDETTPLEAFMSKYEDREEAQTALVRSSLIDGKNDEAFAELMESVVPADTVDQQQQDAIDHLLFSKSGMITDATLAALKKMQMDRQALSKQIS